MTALVSSSAEVYTPTYGKKTPLTITKIKPFDKKYISYSSPPPFGILLGSLT